MLTRAQNALYWRLWAQLHRRDPALDRHQFHLANALPESHLDFRNTDFDRYIAAAKAILYPADLNAQLCQLAQSSNRLLFGIRRLAQKLGILPDAASLSDSPYLQAIIDEMNRKGKLATAHEINPSLEDLPPADLEKIMIALRKHAARSKQSFAEAPF